MNTFFTGAYNGIYAKRHSSQLEDGEEVAQITRKVSAAHYGGSVWSGTGGCNVPLL